jgi:hypothetical protein
MVLAHVLDGDSFLDPISEKALLGRVFNRRPISRIPEAPIQVVYDPLVVAIRGPVMCVDLTVVISDNPAIVLVGPAIIVGNHLAIVSIDFAICFVYGTLEVSFGLPLSRPQPPLKFSRVETLRHRILPVMVALAERVGSW